MKKNALRKSLSLLLALVMVIGLLSATALAAHDPNTGRPTDLNNPVYLSILTAGNSFPGEPTVSNPGNYTGISSTFTAADGTFSDTAENILSQEILNEVTQGVASGVVDHVWGVYDVAGMTNWFTDTFKATLTQNNEKIIKAVLGQDVTASNYEIVWYVIKYQDTSRWWENGYPDGWHIDGLIREASKYSVNYNGNGATGGSVPAGVTDIGTGYTVQDKGTLVRSGALGYTFTGWNTASDGSGTAYSAGDVITRADYPDGTTSMTLYAQWKARTAYIATVNTYLNRLKRDASAIHDTELTLHLSKDSGQTFTALTHSNTGVYTAIVANGTYSLYRKETSGTYEPVGDHTLVISNANGGLDIHHYSVSYDLNGGSLSGGAPEQEILFAGSRVDVIAEEPTREGYYFTGWKDLDAAIYQPGQHLTTDIQKQHHLVAQWADAIDVSVTLIVNNQSSEGDLDDVSTRDARITLAHLLPGEESYTEVNNSSQTKSNVPVPTPDGGTTYEKLYTGLDPSVPYSANVFMHNYKVLSRLETVDANGNYHVTITLQYDPAGFDLEYNVIVDSSVPDEHIPTAIDLKISYSADDRHRGRRKSHHLLLYSET